MTLEEIRMADRGPLTDAKVCFRCKCDRVLKCIDCDGKGKTECRLQFIGIDYIKWPIKQRPPYSRIVRCSSSKLKMKV